MAENQNFAALDWVVGEIDETLSQARQALEAFVENPQDSTRIRFCLTHIHQVHGSLKMVEFFGAALLTEEMEALTQALMNNAVRNPHEAHEVLMRAILQLPIYLEQIRLNRSDDPASLLPLLNDLRAVRGSSLLTESNFFNPNLSAAHKIHGARNLVQSNSVQFNILLIKLRKMYQYAAAGVIQDINQKENVDYLKKVFSRLTRLTEGTARQALWGISWGLAEGMEADGIEITAAVKNLLRKLDSEIQVLTDQSEKSLNTFTHDELIKNLLYYVALSTVETPRISTLRQEYELDKALPSQNINQEPGDLLAGPDPETIRTVVHALNDELGSIKQHLDVGMSGSDHAAVTEALPVMQRVADTLAVLGIAGVRKQLLEHVAALEINVDEPSPELLMNVAGDIIAIEQQLAALASGSSIEDAQNHSITKNIEINQAQESVVREARNGLEQTKDAIIEYIASQWDNSHLQNIPQLLNEVRGGLLMIPLKRAAEVLRSCVTYIEDQLLSSGGNPEWNSLDTLADAIASIEYYLERISSDTEEDDGLLLDLAESSVISLGYGTTQMKSQLNAADGTTVETNTGSEKVEDVEELQIDVLPCSEHQEFQDSDKTTESVTDTGAIESFSQDSDEDEDVIDDEIIEIFIEEAGEVVDAIDEYFPRWAADFENLFALTEFRRAFHTLKGSGRMVGADDLAELAWSVESMLNRVMDATIKPAPIQVALITKVRSIIPNMISAFHNREANPYPELSQQLMAWAGEVALGQEVAIELDGVVTAAIEVTQAESEATVDVVPEKDIKTAPIEQPAVNDVTVSNTTADDLEQLSIDDDDDNAILWEIFVGEALGHLSITEDFIAEMDIAAPLYTTPTADVQRALHTLKGSAHMAGLTNIALLATPLEQFVKELRNYQVEIDDDILQLLRDGVSYTHSALAQISAGEIAEIPKLEQFSARVSELKDRSVGPLIRQQEDAKEHKVDPQLLSIFMAEEMDVLLDSDVLIDRWQVQPNSPEKIDQVLKELSLLARGASQAGLAFMAELSQQLEEFYCAADGDLTMLDAPAYVTLHRAHESLLDMIDGIAAGQNLSPLSDELQNDITRLLSLVAPVQETPVTFDNIEEPSVELDLSDVDENGVDSSPEEITLRDLIAPSVESIDVVSGDEIKHDVEAESSEIIADQEISTEDDFSDSLLADFVDLSLSSEAIGETADLKDSIGDLDETISSELNDLAVSSGDDQTLLDDGDDQPEAQSVLPTTEENIDSFVHDESQSTIDIEDMYTAPLDDNTDSFDDELDPEIIEIFIEEADELMEDIEQSVHHWQENREQSESYGELMRALHTLKGGARLAGLMSIGDLAHDFETDLMKMGDKAKIDQAFFAHIHEYQDKMLKNLEHIKAGVEAGDMNALLSASDEASSANVDDAVDVDVSGDVDAPAQIVENNVVPFTPKDQVPVVTSGDRPQDSGFEMPSPQQDGGSAAPAPLVAKRSAPQEVVKISAELLEDLVNLAGETSISRGRLEEYVNEFGFSIEEMESTIVRLQGQLRRLDIETEAQVAFRQEQLAETEDFDPLEMDRYSHLQQLSRSLIESASDLLDIKSTLGNKARDAETLLLQQSRINTELQEGLMRSRMVPFSRLVPRLRRIVRQVSTELKKQVSFELNNIEGELDRTVLERMVAPLEHMLRNAVDHGLESGEERLAAGKPEEGRIVLTLGREGGDVILRLIDDGRGVNLQRVRAKAVEAGLMAEDSNISDSDIMQFIFSSGFSTAEKISQISGRGVGLDVVSSEIKQLGGAISINSREGEGTEFNVRLPFTVSVNRALMIRIGEDRYAIPLNAIEGIVRISPFELEHYYSDPEARFEYAGESYEVKYLGALLHSNSSPKLEGQGMPIPVVLVRTAQQLVALQVDILMGSREIVVKSMGPQFGQVHAVSGATIMGDGSVVVILDLLAMIRQDTALAHLRSDAIAVTSTPVKEEKITTVMVVDDSVTVRKVTSRFLEREGFEVITAKDGADALMILQDQIPDVMLLDIEMPRMDGFEVAKNVRSSNRLKHLPIIMITSRTGEKHRQHALSLGVNQYMGKPFQENILLQNIKSVTGEVEEPSEP